MSESENWDRADRLIKDLLVPSDAALEHALVTSNEAGLPDIQVTPNQGKLLHLLARACRARRILEIGTLGGYSTIWLARSLGGDGQLVTLELNPKHAEVARASIERAGLSGVVEIRLGPATESLAELVAGNGEAFDFIFIDADKENTATYFSQALELSHQGTVIVVDNVVRQGKVADFAYSDPDVEGIRQFHDRLAGEIRVSATEIQTVGSKGHDGFALAIVVS